MREIPPPGDKPGIACNLLAERVRARAIAESVSATYLPECICYVGLTTDLKRRLGEHYSSKSPLTAGVKPWRLVMFVAFR